MIVVFSYALQSANGAELIVAVPRYQDTMDAHRLQKRHLVGMAIATDSSTCTD